MEQAAKLILAVILMFSGPTFARVEPIKQGAPAPYDGFVFDRESEREASDFRSDAIYYKELSDKLTEKSKLQDEQNQILEKRLQLYINQSNVLIKDRQENETTMRLYMLGAFTLGVIATGLVVRNVRP